MKTEDEIRTELRNTVDNYTRLNSVFIKEGCVDLQKANEDVMGEDKYKELQRVAGLLECKIKTLAWVLGE